MTGNLRFSEGLKVIPLLSPVAYTSTALDTEYVDMKLNHWATFLVHFGATTSDSSDTVTVTVVCSSVSTSATGDGIPFSYRLSGMFEEDNFGAITQATSDGVALTASTDPSLSFTDRTLMISVNADDLPAKKSDGRFLSLVITPTADGAGLVEVTCITEPRYPGNDIPSST
jgi:hypothetical protein